MEMASEGEEGEEEDEEKPSLQLTGGFQWDASVVGEGEGGWDREQANSGSESEGEAEGLEEDDKVGRSPLMAAHFLETFVHSQS